MNKTELAQTEKQQPAEAQRVTYIRPHYEVEENGDYTVKVYMPGVAKDSVNILIDNKTLSIEGQHLKSHIGESWRARYREISTADYRLRLELNIPVNENKISAKTEDGVLIIKLPVEEAAKPRTIVVG